MVGLYRSVAKPRAYLLPPVGLAVRDGSRCRGWQIPSRFARTLAEGAMSARVGHRLTFTRHLSSILVPMIKTKPPRYQTLIERSITAGAFATEQYYVI